MDKLNDKQQEAVGHKDGPLLVVAGAGAGKTRVITHRIAKLIESGVKPEQILAVTFTNKAANEMRERVLKLLGDPEQSKVPFVSTFHSLCVYILRQSGRALGLSRWFTIVDRSDSVAIIKKVMKGLGLDPKQFEPKAILSHISRAKGNLVSQVTYEAENAGDYWGDTVAMVWRDYDAELRRQGALDFDDLLVKAVELFRQEPNVLTKYQAMWHYIHIDEYQDTNKVQYQIAKMLTGDRGNIAVVGDEDQMIYSWRGASLKNILNFEKDYPGAKTVFLEENYRSTKTILEAANSVIKENNERKDKTLFTGREHDEEIVMFDAFDGRDEAYFVVNEAKKLAASGVALEDIAVLYRANFQSRVLEEMFLHEGVPYTVLGTRFFERKEVKDILAYLKLALNPDDRVSLARIINVPRRGIGEKTVEKLLAGQEGELNKGTQDKISNFRLIISNIKAKIEKSKVSEALKYIETITGYAEMLKQMGEEGEERLENIKELVSLATKYDHIDDGFEKLLTESSLASDQDTLDQKKREEKEKKGVRLMTVHAAKGLEFRAVFVVGLEQGLFPHEKLDESLSNKKLEEERRLFYVALTRAKDKLHLSHASVRNIFGSQQVCIPSEFLSLIPSELIREEVSQDKEILGGGLLGDVIDIE